VGIDLDQAQGAPEEAWTPTGTGIVINVSNPGGSALRVQIQGPTGATDANDRWCTKLAVFDQPVSIPWSAFNTACWDGSGSTYNMQPLSGVVLNVPGGSVTAVSFSACIASLSLQTGGGTGGTTGGTTTAAGGTTSTGGSGTTTSAGGPSIDWGDSCEGNGAGTYWRKWGMTNVGGTGTVTITTRVSGNATAGLAGEPDVSNQVDPIAGHEYSLIMQPPVSGVQGSCVKPLAACVFRPCIALTTDFPKTARTGQIVDVTPKRLPHFKVSTELAARVNDGRRSTKAAAAPEPIKSRAPVATVSAREPSEF